ncbi:prepilin-type N-terminal cleavage/methylation domain-containing protein [Opitutaceae bacterium TAV1]|nr:prepilin-type N-terminal cleavage/methylation domain-containing protein [Opitutaceae bacterium TAV1]
MHHPCYPVNPPLHRPPRPALSAFTLIELLTVIAIIGILAGIIIPVVGKARSSADNAQCISSLRQWGIATQLYLNDHRDSLPGPCWAQTMRTKARREDSHLQGYLFPYLNFKGGDPTDRLPDSYICRSWLRNAVDPDAAPIFALGARQQDGTGLTPSPWGNAATPATQPWKYSRLTSDANPSTTRAILELDRQNVGGNTAYQDNSPQKPVHGNHRNALFFDWHVGRQTLDQ